MRPTLSGTFRAQAIDRPAPSLSMTATMMMEAARRAGIGVTAPHALHCAACGARVATMRDTRFGLRPSATFCRSCSAGLVADE